MSKQRTGWVVAVLAAACVLPGCAEVGSLNAWVVDEMRTVTDRTAPFMDPLVFDQIGRKIDLFSAANETVSFQLVVDAGPGWVDGLRIDFDSLTGPEGRIASANFRVFRCLPRRVSEYPTWYLRTAKSPPQPATYYDAMAPVARGAAADSSGRTTGGAFRLAPTERLVLWVDLAVPSNARGGNYTTTMTLRSSSHAPWRASVALKVYSFVLPNARSLTTIGGFDHDMLFRAFLRRDGQPFSPLRLNPRDPTVREGLTVMRRMMQLAHQHRMDLFDSRIRPLLKRDTAGQVRLDWSDYDAIVTPYLDGAAFEDGVGVPAWPAPFSENWPLPRYYDGIGSRNYIATASQLLTQAREHFVSQGTAGQMFLWPYRGKVSQEGYDRYVRLARIARSADGETPLLCQLPPDPPKLSGWRAPQDYRALTEILAPHGEWLDPRLPAESAGPEHPLAGVWLSPGTAPYLPSLAVFASPADARVLPWFAMKYGCKGMFLPDVLGWAGDPSDDAELAESRLFYPPAKAGETVMPSVRLKRLRRGLQDAAYLQLLRKHGREGIARTINSAMARYAGLDAAGDHYLDARLDGWVRSPGTWQTARRLLAEEVEAALHPSEPSSREIVAHRLAWKEFGEKVHSVRVEQVRSRVRPTGEGNRLRATVLLDLHNEYSRDAEVRVKLDELPEGWKVIQGEGILSPLRTGSRGTVALSAEGDHVPVVASGKIALPVTIVLDRVTRKKVQATVAFLVAGQATRPPQIDGVLDDWPIRISNAAGNFRLIGRRGREGDGLAQRQTVAFVLYDEKNLYIAFRCEEPDPDAIKARRTNVIHYEQLMACGEDMVEILLDPGATATGPEGLYHIVVKANGVLRAERGVRSDPPLGKSEPWPVPARVAVGRQQQAWIVEMAIPRSAFGAAGAEAFWGVNFTRFATTGKESSSWSEAPRYFYDPRNLGTLFVRPVAKPGPVR